MQFLKNQILLNPIFENPIEKHNNFEKYNKSNLTQRRRTETHTD
jgi:hypothetical protein